ncbi:hypothetical protein QFC22_002853 [Naganishia vaughanmartiniae]|uniref:Uncharacterized protein n=1 Tax=Naganishia vaughanmartiniae TaxID=1424756 RepID=A0ACC2XBA2_9TREE|nr:hypothetical protein QFC22_002853 [Naganishia vaughanmartiniae]
MLLGSGCTSGHFLCGVSRLSPRSITATMTFFAIAVVTAFISSTASPSSHASAPLLSSITPSYTPIYPTTSDLTLLIALPIALFGIQYLASRLTRKSTTNALVALLSGYTFATGLQLSGMSRPIKVLRFLHLPIPGLFDKEEWDPSLFMVVLGGIVPNAIHYAMKVKPVLEASEKAVEVNNDEKKDTSSPPGTSIKESTITTQAFKYYLPTAAQSYKIDSRLVIGAAIFGLGWGMTGTCLLPSVVNAGSALFGLTQPEKPLLFMCSVIAGLGLGGLV